MPDADDDALPEELGFELELTAIDDGIPTDCVVNFDNIHLIPADAFR